MTEKAEQVLSTIGATAAALGFGGGIVTLIGEYSFEPVGIIFAVLFFGGAGLIMAVAAA